MKTGIFIFLNIFIFVTLFLKTVKNKCLQKYFALLNLCLFFLRFGSELISVLTVISQPRL